MSTFPDSHKVRRTILVIDDQQSVRTTLEYLLGLDGYRVLTADSGLAAIALAERESIDGAIIDVHMPVMDGFATSERLQPIMKATGRSPLKVWFMSGAFSGALKRRSVEVGGLGAFSKPFDPILLAKNLLDGFEAPPPVPAAASIKTGSSEIEDPEALP